MKKTVLTSSGIILSLLSFYIYFNFKPISLAILLIIITMNICFSFYLAHFRLKDNKNKILKTIFMIIFYIIGFTFFGVIIYNGIDDLFNLKLEPVLEILKYAIFTLPLMFIIYPILLFLFEVLSAA